MTPVISPWVFYLMPVCEKFSVLAWITFTICALSCIVIFCILTFEYLTEEDYEKGKRILKTVFVVMIISALLACLIPSEDTIVKMIIAQNVTFERVDMVSDTVVTVYNDIMALFQESGVPNG